MAGFGGPNKRRIIAIVCEGSILGHILALVTAGSFETRGDYMHLLNEQRRNNSSVGTESRQMAPDQIALLKMTRIGLRTQDPRYVFKLNQLAVNGYVTREDVGILPLHLESLRTYWLTEAGKALLAQHHDQQPTSPIEGTGIGTGFGGQRAAGKPSFPGSLFAFSLGHRGSGAAERIAPCHR